MADLYGTNNLSSALESEEMFSFPPNLPPNSSATPSPSPFTSFKANICSFSSLPPPLPVAEETASTAGLNRLSAAILFDSDFCLGDGVSTAVVDSSSNHNFSDSGGLFTTGAKESIRNSFSSGGAAEFDAITSSMKRRKFSTEDDVDDIDFDCEGEVLVDPIMPRSSKRTRAAEIHNLTEKRRRSRINEKLKALQNLIPNSNKTDKASMLDEAIEYLKQLQLQVQMLTMRNGLNLHPVYLSETLQPRQLP